MSPMLTLSVIVPTYCRTQDLCRCLEALKTQAWPPLEVLVTVRDTDAETLAFFAGYGPGALNVRVVPIAVPGVVAAMNAALAVARGEIIALTDDDTVPYPDWLAKIAAHFAADARLGGVGGRDWQINERGNQSVVGKVQWHGRVIGNHHLGAGPPRAVDLLKGANCAYRAVPLKQIGFETRLRGSGAQVHWELCLGLAMRRAGWTLLYDPAVALDHFPAKRHDDDQMTRAGDNFSATALFNATYNETIALWEHLSLARRAVFFLWSFLIGTRGTPGLLQAVRLLCLRRRHVPGRLRAAIAGRWAAIRAANTRATGPCPTTSRTLMI